MSIVGRRAPWRAASLLVLITCAMWTAHARASKLETILMPGELVSGHAKFESECKNCHEPFSKVTQGRRCVGCHDHDDIAGDIRQKRGLHGRLVDPGELDCKRCHTDHQGRKADIVRFDRQHFDHARTDFELRGAHAAVRCPDCHLSGKKFSQAPSQCVACHRKDNPHKQDLGEDCGKCHNERSWTRTSAFDHDKTRFPLRGKHRDAPCSACHPNERYKNIAMGCIDCHRLNDIHQSRYGVKCQDCHGETKWKDIRFDHDRLTKYPLEGRHRQVACDDCHKGDLYRDKLQTTCVSCHRNDDAHKGQFGAKCETCHRTVEWGKNTFDHDKDTHYKLVGRHREIKCIQCHGGDLYREKLASDCIACHRQDDRHNGQQGKKCDNCHNEGSWAKRIVFDHDVTHFPLIGVHAVTPCQECHLTAAFKDARPACDACHAKDDVHKERLGTACARCHNPNGWRLWIFDHDRQTRFKLSGKHASASCYACHTVRVQDRVRLPMDCGSCHRRDDVHAGGFGPRCERCHDTEDFKHIHIH
jgi:hypothetical protein